MLLESKCRSFLWRISLLPGFSLKIGNSLLQFLETGCSLAGTSYASHQHHGENYRRLQSAMSRESLAWGTEEQRMQRSFSRAMCATTLCREVQRVVSLHRAHCHHELCSVLHKGCGEQAGRGGLGAAVVFQLCGRSLGCLAGSNEELCVLLPCSMHDITCEAGAGCQASLFTRFDWMTGREGWQGGPYLLEDAKGLT